MPKCGCNDKDKTEKIAKEIKITRTQEKKSPSKPPKEKS